MARLASAQKWPRKLRRYKLPFQLTGCNFMQRWQNLIQQLLYRGHVAFQEQIEALGERGLSRHYVCYLNDSLASFLRRSSALFAFQPWNW